MAFQCQRKTAKSLVEAKAEVSISEAEVIVSETEVIVSEAEVSVSEAEVEPCLDVLKDSLLSGSIPSRNVFLSPNGK